MGISRLLNLVIVVGLGLITDRCLALADCRSVSPNTMDTVDRALLGEEDAVVQLFREALDSCLDVEKSMLALSMQFAYENHPRGTGQGAWALQKNAEGDPEVAEPFLRLGLVVFAARHGSCPALVDRIVTAHEMGLGSAKVFRVWLAEAMDQGNGTAHLFQALRDLEDDPGSEIASTRYFNLRSLVDEHEIAVYADEIESASIREYTHGEGLTEENTRAVDVKCRPSMKVAATLRSIIGPAGK